MTTPPLADRAPIDPAEQYDPSPSNPSAYDQLPYPHRAFPQTHPDLLATVATVFGLTPAPVGRCRVLEIGCGSGGNLIPMADGLPGATFLGIDPSGRQIETGRALVRAARLDNVDLQRLGIEELSAGAGPFDYVVAHGVYSRVAEPVREQLLAACARHLAPHGVAYVSYNALPGWSASAALRDAMRYHARGAATTGERVRRARAVLDFLVNAAPADRAVPGGALGGALTPAWGATLRALAESVRALPEPNLVHDYLADANDARYFHEFMGRAAAHGLQYLGEAQVETMSTAAFGAGVDAALRGVAGDWIEAEQALDVLRNRAFRQTLLVRADAPLRRQIDPSWVKALYAGSAAEPQPDEGTDAETFALPKGSQLSTSDPLTRAALRALAEAWPGRLSFRDLLAATWQHLGLGGGDVVGLLKPQPIGGASAPSDTSATERKLASVLLQGFFTGMVDLSVRPATWAAALPNRPAARRLARLQVEADDTVATLRHQNLKLNRMARQLLRLLDGTRDRAALLKDLERTIHDSAASIGGTAVFEADDRARLARGLEHDLKRFVAEGLLLP